MSFSKYEAYKNSGVEWLGEVPEQWSISPLKRNSTCNDKALSDATPEDYEIEYVEISDVDEIKGITGSTSYVFAVAPSRARRIVQNGDVLVSTVRTYLRAITPVINPPSNLIASTGFAVVRPQYNGLQGEYLGYLLRAEWWIAEVISKSVGVSYPAINASDLIEIKVPIPGGPEQTQIAHFLDHETARIDALIAEQQRLIELLKEKRQAVISHAVTKGLDPTVPMKDSGVEWLGEVPEHWRVGKFRWFLRTASGGTPPSGDRSTYYDGNIPWLRSLDLNDDFVTDYEVGVTQKALNETSCKMVPKKSVLIAMYGGDGTIGKHGLLMFDSAINQALCAFLPSPNFDPEYLHRYIQFYRPYWMIGAESSRKDPNIGQDRIGDHCVVIPSIQEQKNISKFLVEELSKLNNLSTKANLLVSFLQERRSALISAAVTGKIDVRGWQSPASAETEPAQVITHG